MREINKLKQIILKLYFIYGTNFHIHTHTHTRTQHTAKHMSYRI
jgi:hypothetical protein